WLAASFRETDRTGSRVVRNRLLQPWQPFTRASAEPLTPGEAVEMPVEVFPTNAVIRKGRRLKVSVTPSDFPHSVPPLPQFAGTLAGRVEILPDGEHPSSVVLPRVRRRCPGTKKRAACRPLPVPDLVRG